MLMPFNMIMPIDA